jgi:hypothetical protein
MCEFCTEHGEGKTWYLQMKNYSNVLLHEPLAPDQQAIVGAGHAPSGTSSSLVVFSRQRSLR